MFKRVKSKADRNPESERKHESARISRAEGFMQREKWEGKLAHMLLVFRQGGVWVLYERSVQAVCTGSSYLVGVRGGYLVPKQQDVAAPAIQP
jgi:hypothetical protein